MISNHTLQTKNQMVKTFSLKKKGFDLFKQDKKDKKDKKEKAKESHPNLKISPEKIQDDPNEKISDFLFKRLTQLSDDFQKLSEEEKNTQIDLINKKIKSSGWSYQFDRDTIKKMLESNLILQKKLRDDPVFGNILKEFENKTPKERETEIKKNVSSMREALEKAKKAESKKPKKETKKEKEEEEEEPEIEKEYLEKLEKAFGLMLKKGFLVSAICGGIVLALYSHSMMKEAQIHGNTL